MEIDITQIITSILAVIGSLIGTFSVLTHKSKTEAIKDAEREQAQKDQFERIFEEQKEIKERLDKHNGYAEKFAENSKQIAIMNDRQIQMQKDIDFLKTERCKI